MKERIKNTEDTIMKYVMSVFQDDALEFFGINKKIISSARTELKDIEVSSAFLDYTFLLEDDTILHFEFQTTFKDDDLKRFLAYDSLLHKKEGKTINTVIVLSSNIVNVKEVYNIGSIIYKPQYFFMKDLNGDEQFEKIKNKIENKEDLSKVDLLAIVFMPLMKSKVDKSERIIETIELSRNIKDEKTELVLQSLLYAFATKFVNDNELKKVKEVFRLTKLGRSLLDEGIQEGIEKGKEIGKEIGKEMGKEIGKEIGKELGLEIATKIIKLIIKGLKTSEISEVLDVKAEDVEKIRNELQETH